MGSPYMGSAIYGECHLTLSDLERSKSGRSHFEGSYPVKESS